MFCLCGLYSAAATTSKSGLNQSPTVISPHLSDSFCNNRAKTKEQNALQLQVSATLASAALAQTLPRPIKPMQMEQVAYRVGDNTLCGEWTANHRRDGKHLTQRTQVPLEVAMSSSRPPGLPV